VRLKLQKFIFPFTLNISYYSMNFEFYEKNKGLNPFYKV